MHRPGADLIPKITAQCSDPACTELATRRGMCQKHYRRERRVENGDQIRATRAVWRDQNRERINAVYAAWEKRNPEKVSLRDRQNKGRRRAAIGSPDPVNYALILAEHSMICHLCGQPIDGLANLHFDHVIPLARGGAHTAENIRPAHKRCNLRKGARLLYKIPEADRPPRIARGGGDLPHEHHDPRRSGTPRRTSDRSDGHAVPER